MSNKAARAAARALLGLDDEPIEERKSGKELQVGKSITPKAAGKGGVHKKVHPQAQDTGEANADTDPHPPIVTGTKSSIPAHVPQPIDPKLYPQKWKVGELAAGMSVFYRGERYWVEMVPPTWQQSCCIMICNERSRPGDPMPRGKNTERFWCHADCLTAAPVTRNIYGRQPTQAAVERKERAKAGVRDVGDGIATMLRGAAPMEDCYKAGARYLGVNVLELKSKYGHLNPGQQRMNVGNRMRAKYRQEQKNAK